MDHTDQEVTMTQALVPARLPATLRLGENSTNTSKKAGRTIPIAPQSKSVGKRKVQPKKCVVRSPLQTLIQRKTLTGRTTTTTRMKLAVDKDSTLPCNKAGSSKQRKKNEPPTTVCIPAVLEVGRIFGTIENRFLSYLKLELSRTGERPYNPEKGNL